MTLKVVSKTKTILSKWQNQTRPRTHQVKQEIHLEETEETIRQHLEKLHHLHQRNRFSI